MDDTRSQPFAARSLPPATNATSLRERAVAASRSKYGRPVERIEKIIKKWSETRFRPGQAPIPPAWAVKEEQKVQEVPVEGEPAATPDLSPQPVPSPQQQEQSAPKPFFRENIPGFAENQPPTSNLTEKSEEVDIYRFPEIKSGNIYQPREVARDQNEPSFSKRSEENIVIDQGSGRGDQSGKN